MPGNNVTSKSAQDESRCLRDTDTVARLGGDEFTILLPDVDSPQSTGEVAERILNDFAQPFSDAEQELYVSPSIGISLFPRDGAAPEDLVKHADTAMYSAKDAGRNRYCYFTESLNHEVREKVMMENGLRRPSSAANCDCSTSPRSISYRPV